MENIIDILQNINLFKCFSYEELDNLLARDYYKIDSHTKNSIIYLQNEKCENLDVILNGTISILKIDIDGNVLNINDFRSGDIFGESLLFSNSNTFPMTIVAKQDTTILHLKKELIIKLCQNNACFLINFLMSLTDKTVILSNKIKSLTMKTLRQCIIEFLIFEYIFQKSTKIKLNMSKKELAEKIGVQRSSLSRELNKMRNDGLINYDAKCININDIDLLRKLHIDN